MKAKIIRLTDEKRYHFRNEALNKDFEILKVERDSLLGNLYTLDTEKLLGSVTAWTSNFLEFEKKGNIAIVANGLESYQRIFGCELKLVWEKHFPETTKGMYSFEDVEEYILEKKKYG